MIYFIRNSNGEGPVKIGCSCAPSVRIRQLEFDVRAKFDILAEAPGSFTQERNLHLKFAHLRAANKDVPRFGHAGCAHTEWYRPEPELLAYIDSVKATGPIYLRPRECREKVIAKRYRAGETLKQIGDSYGITREAVRLILRRHGVPSLGRRAKPPSAWLLAWRADRSAAA